MGYLRTKKPNRPNHKILHLFHAGAAVATWRQYGRIRVTLDYMNWREWFKSDHTRYLELEVLRLRTELTKWQDAALQSKGLPAISKPEPGQSFAPKPRMLPSQFRRKYEEMSVKDWGKPDAKN